MNNAKIDCLNALKSFIDNSCNENKMELIISYDEITDDNKIAVLGEELNFAINRIVMDNFHPDEYLAVLKSTFFK